MGKHRKVKGPSPPDRWTQANVFATIARLAYDVYRWMTDGGPGL